MNQNIVRAGCLIIFNSTGGYGILSTLKLYEIVPINTPAVWSIAIGSVTGIALGVCVKSNTKVAMICLLGVFAFIISAAYTEVRWAELNKAKHGLHLQSTDSIPVSPNQ